MARLVFGMMQSLDGYVDDRDGGLVMGPPELAVFRHFTEHVRGVAGLLYGRRIYELMRVWENDRPEWDADFRAFAAAWRAQPKWVASRTLNVVGPNATLICGDIGSFVRTLKDNVEGDIDVAGPEFAHALTCLDLIDEYRLYLRTCVLGGGKPYFAGPRPPLRLAATDRIGNEVMRLTYVPA